MDKTFTPHDLQHYLEEVIKAEKSLENGRNARHDPSSYVLQNILRYSSAINVFKTRSVGTIFQLGN